MDLKVLLLCAGMLCAGAYADVEIDGYPTDEEETTEEGVVTPATLPSDNDNSSTPVHTTYVTAPPDCTPQPTHNEEETTLEPQVSTDAQGGEEDGEE